MTTLDLLKKASASTEGTVLDLLSNPIVNVDGMLVEEVDIVEEIVDTVIEEVVEDEVTLVDEGENVNIVVTVDEIIIEEVEEEWQSL